MPTKENRISFLVLFFANSIKSSAYIYESGYKQLVIYVKNYLWTYIFVIYDHFKVDLHLKINFWWFRSFLYFLSTNEGVDIKQSLIHHLQYLRKCESISSRSNWSRTMCKKKSKACCNQIRFNEHQCTS